MEDIKIVKMEVSHLSEVLKLHMLSFRGYPSTKLGKSYLLPLFKLFLNCDSAVNLVAFYQGKIFGYVIGISPNIQKKFNKKLLFLVFLSFLKRPYLIFNFKILKKIYYRFLNLFKKSSYLLNLPEPLISLVGIGVLPEGKGKGIGKALIDNFEEESKRKSYKSLKLTVYKDNIVARKFYEKNGWIPYFLPLDFLIYYKILNDDEK